MTTEETIDLLKKLIATPSLSGNEEQTAEILKSKLRKHGIPPMDLKNNIWARNLHFDEDKLTVLLNSHHDTVKPAAHWGSDPFEAVEKEGKITGLGSNDAGASLVCLLSAFIHFYDKKLPFNLIFAASAEEETSGKNGMALLVPELGKIDFAIVGEPTCLDMAVAEKGLMVVDCCAKGKAGHAARGEGINAIYIALRDIAWLQHYQFPKISETLGPVHTAVTIIQAGSQHNVVPHECRFTIDIRTTDKYTNEEVLDILQSNMSSEVEARSLRLSPSGVPEDHEILKVAEKLGMRIYGSPTLSDQSLMPWPSVKIGPGDSARSHTANEYIMKGEIQNGIEVYKRIINELSDLNLRHPN